jgi:hypothetical protein
MLQSVPTVGGVPLALLEAAPIAELMSTELVGVKRTSANYSTQDAAPAAPDRRILETGRIVLLTTLYYAAFNKWGSATIAFGVFHLWITLCRGCRHRGVSRLR